ncbi:MAG: MFS transporter [Anaerolineae bacterium CFX3]|mgnify:FL=1|nr:putative L-galactonate transporter [Anaerolineales bacterium]MCE7906171.1 MFS transporter [Anaerolineae bacterium CFX3]MCQ3947550.1 MFS transporter [Anaerolineae bacterium]OQY83028.1 MAG: MFS transporter [Anaerolineae bacterium UTCFX3]RIK27927.1 MAG: MFS transporter [Anaerolineae bacterium]
MSEKRTGYRAFVIVVFFLFVLLHQTDKLLIGSMQLPVSETFGLNDLQWGFINTGALIVGTIFYPLWGYLYDRYARAKLLALASFIWGATTWLSAVVRTYPQFLVTRSSTGVDDSSYPGLYSLAADYFGPKLRGRVYGILQLAQPIGYLLGMILALMVAPNLDGLIFRLEGWRTIFLFTGLLGIAMAAVIYFGIKEAPRGQAEEEFEGQEIGQFRFNWDALKDVMKKKTMWFVFLQGFAGVFPWNVITFFFFGYLMTERGYDNDAVLLTMGPVVLILAGGYFVGGMLGDWLFKRTLKGRIIVSSVGVILGALFLFLAMNTPVDQRTTFFILMCLTALFMPFSSPNVTSTVFDISLPEIRSSAQAVEYFIENSGAALAPTLAGAIAFSTGSKQFAITVVCVTAWVLCFFLYLGALFFVERDIKSLHAQLAERAKNL